MRGEEFACQFTLSVILMLCLSRCLDAQTIECFHEAEANTERFDREQAKIDNKIEDKCVGCTTTIIDKGQKHLEQRTCSRIKPPHDTTEQLDVVFDPTTKKTMRTVVRRTTTCYQPLCNGEDAKPQDPCKTAIKISSRGVGSSPHTFLIILVVFILNHTFAFLFREDI
ncbi:unnamed protein product [Calicophoron daubneyi]|uniref:Uncharacterized protein n=1 Tax=Calicophoron daubneyi TaxID=300641 RepID=A0AAV2T5Y9_CALDB